MSFPDGAFKIIEEGDTTSKFKNTSNYVIPINYRHFAYFIFYY